jgi:hypothetical protein
LHVLNGLSLQTTQLLQPPPPRSPNTPGQTNSNPSAAHGSPPSTAPSSSSPQPSPSSDQAIATALAQAKAAKARLSEHKTRARADANRLALVLATAKRDKEMLAARERYAHYARRCEVYALNHVKRLYHEEMFALFMEAREGKTPADSGASSMAATMIPGGAASSRRRTQFDSDIASI